MNTNHPTAVSRADTEALPFYVDDPMVLYLVTKKTLSMLKKFGNIQILQHIDVSTQIAIAKPCPTSLQMTWPNLSVFLSRLKTFSRFWKGCVTVTLDATLAWAL